MELIPIHHLMSSEHSLRTSLNLVVVKPRRLTLTRTRVLLMWLLLIKEVSYTYSRVFTFLSIHRQTNTCVCKHIHASVFIMMFTSMRVSTPRRNMSTETHTHMHTCAYTLRPCAGLVSAEGPQPVCGLDFFICCGVGQTSAVRAGLQARI